MLNVVIFLSGDGRLNAFQNYMEKTYSVERTLLIAITGSRINGTGFCSEGLRVVYNYLSQTTSSKISLLLLSLELIKAGVFSLLL